MRAGKAMGGLKPPIIFYCIVQCLWNIIFQDPENAITFSDKRNLWPNTASKLSVQILTYLKQYAPFCPTIFSLFPDRFSQGQALAQILRLPRKIKTKCIFRVKQPCFKHHVFDNIEPTFFNFSQFTLKPQCLHHLFQLRWHCYWLVR